MDYGSCTVLYKQRIWIVDNSGSMQKTDGHRLVETGKRQHVKFVECSRWEEITGKRIPPKKL